jgi:hypothetical protein
MSQTKANPHKLSISQKASGISVGANTKIELDGKPLKYVKFLKLEFHSARVTKVMIEMFVEIDDIDLETNLEFLGTKEINDSNKYVLGEYCSVGSLNPKDQTSS